MRILATFALLLAGACSGGEGSPNGVPAPGTPSPPPHAPAQLLVMLENPDEQDDIDDLAAEFGLVGVERIGQTAFFFVEISAATDLDELLKELDDDGRVIVSELDYLAESPEGGPTDVAVTGSDILLSIPTQPALANLDLTAAHAVTTGGGIVVAVVDTGLDPTQPFLAGQIEPGGFDFLDQDGDPTDERNFLDDDGDGVADEQFGHGTFVASMILAVAPDARILPVRSLDAEGFGTASTVAAGIVWAADMGAAVICVSVDIPDASKVVKEAIGYAEDQDVLIVAAAGNSGANDLVFPARFGDVVGVAAVDATGVVAPFSNVGSKTSLVAPGVELIGAVPLTMNPPGTARWSGTSFAAPLVAGSAALVRSAMPALDRGEVAQRLRDTAAPVDALNPAHVGRLGAGLVQPAAALR